MRAYIEGRSLLENGDLAGAAEPLVRARDLEIPPTRATSPILGAVRRLGDEPGIFLADAESAIWADANGPPGFAHIADHVHPTAKGSAIIAREVMAQLIAAGLVPDPGVAKAELCPLAKFLAAPETQKGEEPELEYLLANTNFGRWDWLREGILPAEFPFLREAKERFPNSPAVLAKAGCYSLHRGEEEEARRLLTKARPDGDAAALLDDSTLRPCLQPALQHRCPDKDPVDCLDSLLGH